MPGHGEYYSRSETFVFKFFLVAFLLLVPAYRWLAIYANIVASDLPFLALLMVLMARFLMKGEAFSVSRLNILFWGGMICFWLFSLIFATEPFRGLDNIVQYLFLIAIFIFFYKRPFRERDLKWLMLGSVVFALFATGELILTPILEGGRYVFGSRFIREATHPQIVVSALFPIAMVLWGATRQKFYAVTALTLYLLLIFSFSRGGLIAIHLVLFCMLFVQKTRGVAVKAWVIVFATILGLRAIIGPEHFIHFFLRVASIFSLAGVSKLEGHIIGSEHAADRIALVKTIFCESLDWRLLWGHGIDSFVSDVSSFGGPWISGDGLTKMSTHNLPMMILYEQGLLMTVLMFSFLAYLIYRLLAANSRDPLKYGFVFSLIALFINSNTDPGVIVERITWVILGMAAAFIMSQSKVSSESVQPTIA